MAQEVIEVTQREVEIIEVIERGPVGPTGPQPDINYEVVSSARTLEAADLIAADTSGGAFTLTLPANPSNGDAVDIFDFSETFDTNPLTIARNGSKIESLTEDLICNVEGAYFTLIYTGATRGWQVLPRYGTSGGGGESALTTEGDMLYRGAAVNTRLGIGTAGQVLKVNSGATAPEWGSAGVASVSGTAPIVSSGGATPAISITAATTSAAGSMSSADKTKLDGIAAGAEVNVNADWDAASGDAQILNKPATFTPSSHTHGSITNDGKISGAPSGLPVVTTTDGAVTTLALGTANQVLRVNAGETGVEFGAGFDAASPPAIGSTTPNTGAFTTLDVLTKGASLNLRTNNDGLAGLNTFTSVNNAIGINIGGTSHATLLISGVPFFTLTRDTVLTWRTATNGPFSGTQASLYAEDQNVLAQRVTTNPQTFNIYNTFTSATNHERGFLRWSSNVLQIGTEKGSGGGTARALEFQTDGATRFVLAAANTATFAGGLALRWGSGATKIIGTTFPSGLLQFQTGSTDRLTIDSNGIIGFGGTTSSFPALKRSSTTLQVRLANDSGFAPLSAGLITATGNLILTDNDGPHTATFDAQSKLTANRTYDLPDQSGTLALTSDITITSDPSGVTGADAVTNIMSLTTAEYAAIVTPDAATLYLITDP